MTAPFREEQAQRKVRDSFTDGTTPDSRLAAISAGRRTCRVIATTGRAWGWWLNDELAATPAVALGGGLSKRADQEPASDS